MQKVSSKKVHMFLWKVKYFYITVMVWFLLQKRIGNKIPGMAGIVLGDV